MQEVSFWDVRNAVSYRNGKIQLLNAIHRLHMQLLYNSLRILACCHRQILLGINGLNGMELITPEPSELIQTFRFVLYPGRLFLCLWMNIRGLFSQMRD